MSETDHVNWFFVAATQSHGFIDKYNLASQ